MPSKMMTICYVHNFSEKQTNNFIIKEITGITKLNKEDVKKVTFLQIKVFLPIGQTFESPIESCETDNIIYLKGKFVAYQNYYIVCITLKKKNFF